MPLAAAFRFALEGALLASRCSRAWSGTGPILLAFSCNALKTSLTWHDLYNICSVTTCWWLSVCVWLLMTSLAACHGGHVLVVEGQDLFTWTLPSLCPKHRGIQGVTSRRRPGARAIRFSTPPGQLQLPGRGHPARPPPPPAMHHRQLQNFRSCSLLNAGWLLGHQEMYFSRVGIACNGHQT